MALILGAILVAAGVMLFVLIPILRGEWASLERTGHEVAERDARKTVALRGLRDAEYDYRAGKLNQEDYEALKAETGREALAAIEEPGETIEDELEAEIARAHRGLAEGRTCGSCGHLNVTGSKFCTGCGGPLGRGSADETPASG